MIYFITDGLHIKVGTALDLKKRLGQIKAGNPRQLSVLATCEGGHALEQDLHRALSRYRAEGSAEWYLPALPIRRLVRRVARSGPSAVHSRIAARKRSIRMSRSKSDLAAKKFGTDLARFIGDLTAERGTKAIADMIGVTEASVRLNRQGKVQMTALNLAKLGCYEPVRVQALLEGRLYT
jgi:hypothetical protein